MKKEEKKNPLLVYEAVLVPRALAWPQGGLVVVLMLVLVLVVVVVGSLSSPSTPIQPQATPQGTTMP